MKRSRGFGFEKDADGVLDAGGQFPWGGAFGGKGDRERGHGGHLRPRPGRAPRLHSLAARASGLTPLPSMT